MPPRYFRHPTSSTAEPPAPVRHPTSLEAIATHTLPPLRLRKARGACAMVDTAPSRGRGAQRMTDKSNVTDHRTYGAAILQRLTGIVVPAALKGPARAFKLEHDGYESGCKAADQ